MSNKRIENSATREAFGNSPPYMLGYVVRPAGDGSHSAWSRIASAKLHDDGRGYDVELVATPLDGHIVLRMVPDPGEVPGEDVMPVQHLFRS